jgi:hypothetical protein
MRAHQSCRLTSHGHLRVLTPLCVYSQMWQGLTNTEVHTMSGMLLSCACTVRPYSDCIHNNNNNNKTKTSGCSPQTNPQKGVVPLNTYSIITFISIPYHHETQHHHNNIQPMHMCVRGLPCPLCFVRVECLWCVLFVSPPCLDNCNLKTTVTSTQVFTQQQHQHSVLA